jgi:hypothetical protein
VDRADFSEREGVMATGEKYPVGTIVEMARIPVEARARFLAELPAILNELPAIEAALPEMAQEAHAKIPSLLRWMISPKKLAKAMGRQMVSRSFWVDDDKGTATVSMSVSAGHEPFFSRSVKMDPRP